MSKSTKLFTPQFIVLCLSSVLFMGSFNMIIPELPSYLSRMGGEEYKGYIISLFTITAALSRPLSGKLADKVGRIPVMIIGAIVSAVCSVLYLWFTTVALFLLLRFIHGFSTGFKPTGTTAYLADILHPSRRGEGLGLIGVSGSIGMAAGPAIGSWLAMEYSLDAMFMVSALTGLLSMLTVIGMKESLENKESLSVEHFKITWKDVYDPAVKEPSIVMLLTYLSFGTLLTVVPDYSDYLGVANRGYFFTAMLIASILTRLFAGKASDIYGRRPTLIIGVTWLIASMILLAFVQTQIQFLAVAFSIGIATGINSPTLFAWTVDLSAADGRGRSMATLFIALEIGVGLGAFFSAMIYNNQAFNFPLTFAIPGILGIPALALLLSTRAKKNRLKTKKK